MTRMNLTVRIALLAASVLLLSAAPAVPAITAAADAAAEERPGEQEPVNLPLTRAVLFASGVGYFEHAGTIDGEQTVRILFSEDQINDILKSMVVLEGAGALTGVSYAANEPLDRALKSFGIDLSDNPTLADLLGELRGVRISLHAPDRIEGRILNVESKTLTRNGERQTEHTLNLVTDTGIRSIPMRSVDSIQLADHALQEELNQALLLLAGARDTDQKPVDLHFAGRGERDVRIGYLIETPVWKTSYRLDLAGSEPLLQGWAIVENTTNIDWRGIHLSLVSGRPISFVQDLYTPLYVERPVVEPEMFASLRPREYRRGLASPKMQPDAEPAPGLAQRRAADEMRGRAGGGLPFGEAPRAELDPDLTIAASGDALGEMFQFTLDQAVDLNRRRSSMLPIINHHVEAERVSIYNHDVQREHPLNGVSLTNSSEMKLLAGPMTVFDDGAYAGDARIGHLAPGETRLLSYAIDLDVSVARETVSDGGQITEVRIVNGVLRATRAREFIATYRIDNRAGRARTMIIEHDRHHRGELMEPAAYEEMTDDLYRFRVTVPAGETETLTVRERVPMTETIALLDRPVGAYEQYMTSGRVRPEVREALEHVAGMRAVLSSLQRERDEAKQERQSIQAGQERLRRNIETVGIESTLGKRYLTRLSEDEDRIEELEAKIADLEEEIRVKRREFEDHLMNLNIE